MENQGLPVLAYGVLLSDNSLICIKRGQKGYFQLSHIYKAAYQPEKMGLPDMHAVADKLNERMGVSKAQREAMECGSMFGWDVPGANPAAYEGKL